MAKPLEGIKIVEVAMWAFVPAAGAMLADMGATVIKVEPPTGDPMRGLSRGSGGPEQHGFVLSWENYNRGKRSITLDLKQDSGIAVLYRLLADADVFLTNLLPPARLRMGIDEEAIRRRFPNLIYAAGSGVGTRGPEADKGGFNSITFWARGGIAAAASPDDADEPAGLPTGAFGDCTSGAMLAGGVAAAIARRAMTGEASTVDVSLLASAMWVGQRAITETTLEGVERLSRPGRMTMVNPLVNVYRTQDGRFLSLCMLQAQRFWPGFCKALGRPELIDDPRFATADLRAENREACIGEIDRTFAERPLAEWRERLGRQEGQWDVVQNPGELQHDQQVLANGFMQRIDYADGRRLAMVSAPMQFDGVPLSAGPAPELSADSDSILADLGYDEDGIIDLKVAGVVF